MNQDNQRANMASLQAALMQAMHDVRDGNLDLDKAKAVNDIAQTLVGSAKVEIDFLRATNSAQSAFFQRDDFGHEELPAGSTQTVKLAPWPQAKTSRHKLE